MRKILVLLILFAVASCGSVKKKTTYSKSRSRTVSVKAEPADDHLPGRSVRPYKGKKNTSAKADNIINTALEYSGVRYKYGGTTKKGMDCSGLVYVAFGENNISLPRVSRDMAKTGRQVRVKDVEKGDLLFFNTTKKGRGINHVGMVVAIEEDEIKFIHASSSRGVIVSSLREGYWNYAFIKATRIL